MTFCTIQEIEQGLIHEHERGAIDEQTLDKRRVQVGYMVEDLLKDFQHQEIPENHSLDYVGNGCWKHEKGGFISGVTELSVNKLGEQWRYQASLFVPEQGNEGFSERVFDHFIDANQWLGELRK